MQRVKLNEGHLGQMTHERDSVDDSIGNTSKRSKADSSATADTAIDQNSPNEVLSGQIEPLNQQSISICNIPSQCEYFVERNSILAEVKRALDEDISDTEACHVVLTGQEGVGKNELAIHFVHTYKSEYALVRCLHAGDNLAEEFRQFAEELGISKDKSDEVIISDIYTKLDGLNYLLVIRNALNYASIRKFLPVSQQPNLNLTVGRVLITSCHHQWSRCIPVDVFTPDEAWEYISTRLLGEGDNKQKLIDSLGCSPLVLSMAVGYIDRNMISIKTFLDRFETDIAKTIEDWAAGSQDEHVRYRATLLTIFVWASTLINNESSAAGDLLRTCAFLGSNKIPISLFTLLDSASLHEMLELLRQYSLITVKEDHFEVHSSVREVTLTRLAATRYLTSWLDGSLTWLGSNSPKSRVFYEGFQNEPLNSAIRAVNDSLHYDRRNYTSSQQNRLLISHAHVLVGYARRTRLKTSDVVCLSMTLGSYYLFERRDYRTAYNILSWGSEIAAKVQLKDQPYAMGKLYNYVAVAAYGMHDADKVKKFVELSQHFYQSLMASIDHKDTSKYLDGLAMLSLLQGHLLLQENTCEARKLYFDSYRMYVQLDGQHPRIEAVEVLVAIANSYWLDGNWLLAEICYLRAWLNLLALGGEGSLLEGDIAAKMAEIYYKIDKYYIAQSYAVYAIQIERKILNSAHDRLMKSNERLQRIQSKLEPEKCSKFQGLWLKVEPESLMARLKWRLSLTEPDLYKELTENLVLREGDGRIDTALPGVAQNPLTKFYTSPEPAAAAVAEPCPSVVCSSSPSRGSLL